MLENHFKGKVAIITGGSRGIGFATVKAFLAEGAKVCFLSHYQETGEKAMEELMKINPEYEVMHRVIDLCDWKAAKELFAEVEEKWGRVDVLINNAGMDSNTHLNKLKQSEWDEVCNLNMKAIYNMCKYGIKVLKKTKGCIINTASVAGRFGAPTGLPYPTSKAAVISMSESLAWTFAPLGVRVNCIAPGVTDTDMIANLPDFAKKSIEGGIPFERLAKPEEIAYAMLFLASDYAAYITGQCLGVDGGYRPSNLTK